MCGRKWRADWEFSQIKLRLDLRKIGPTNFPPRYNIAPTQALEVVYLDAAGERAMEPFRWGLLPPWSKDRKGAAMCINARAETIATKPSFRSAFKARRCLVPVTGYYEWQILDAPDARGKPQKQPWAIAATDARSDAMLVMAGLWESWTDPETKEDVRTYAVATTEPGPDVAGIHDRQPVVLPPEAWSTWLGETPATPEELHALLRPAPAATLHRWRVGSAVGKVANDGPELVEPI